MRKAFVGILLGLLLGSMAIVGAQPYSAQIEQAIRSLTNGVRAFTTLAFVDGTTQTTAAISGAPVGASFITQKAEGGLSGEQALGTLTTGLTLNTVTAGVGVLSTFSPSAVCGAGTFVTTLSASGATTCGTPAITGSSKLSAFAATTSTELAGVISDETGTGLLVFDMAPAFSTTARFGVATTYDGIIISPTAKGANQFDLTLSTLDLTAGRAINFPNAGGTVITTGNLSDITATGTLTDLTVTNPISGSVTGTSATVTGATQASITSAANLTTVGTITTGGFPAANLTGTALPAAVVTSSLTAVGTITTGIWNAGAVTSSGDITYGGNSATTGALVAAGTNGLGIAATHGSGALRFYSGGTTLRGMVDANGKWLFGGVTTSTLNDYVTIKTDGSVVGLAIEDPVNVSGVNFLHFVSNGAVAGVVTRVAQTAAIVYTTTSDQRLKTDLGLASDISRLRLLRIHDFVWVGTTTQDRGVFAQEAAGLYPLAITQGTDERNPLGGLVRPWGASYASFVPDLIVGWQQHEARLQSQDVYIQLLEARISALEAR